MSKDKLTDYDATASNNTDVGGISVAEGMLPSGVNNAIREQMSHLKDFASGTEAITKLSTASIDANGGTIKLDGNYPVGTGNVALGDAALDDGSLSGGNNTAVGSGALTANTSGAGNVALGSNSLPAVTTGNNNVAIGTNSLQSNTASDNVAVGLNAMLSNTSGASNVAVGRQSLNSNTTADNNTAVGYQAGYSNTTGQVNNYFGVQAGYSNTTAPANNFFGWYAGQASTGGFNTFVGHAAGGLVTTGTGNTFIGTNQPGSHGAGYYVTTGSKNTILGGYSGNQGGIDFRTSNNNIVLSDGDGNPRFFVSGEPYVYAPPIYAGTTGGAANVHILSNGAMLRSTSSLRYKNTVEDATNGLTELLALRPVTYKGNNDGDTIFGGLIAEEVHDAGLTEFVQYNDDNEPDALAYGNMVSLCIKAIQEQQETITALTARIEALEAN